MNITTLDRPIETTRECLPLAAIAKNHGRFLGAYIYWQDREEVNWDLKHANSRVIHVRCDEGTNVYEVPNEAL